MMIINDNDNDSTVLTYSLQINNFELKCKIDKCDAYNYLTLNARGSSYLLIEREGFIFDIKMNAKVSKRFMLKRQSHIHIRNHHLLNRSRCLSYPKWLLLYS